MTTFQGIPAGAFGFYEELQDNNNREWWQEHKAGYQSLVKEPLASLLAELEPRYGPAKLFRPNRDIRFSEDKSPYKTAQGAVASVQEGVGYYLQISADGLLVGGAATRTPLRSWPATATRWTLQAQARLSATSWRLLPRPASPLRARN